VNAQSEDYCADQKKDDKHRQSPPRQPEEHADRRGWVNRTAVWISFHGRYERNAALGYEKNHGAMWIAGSQLDLDR
jgi:hypothetical protein